MSKQLFVKFSRRVMGNGVFIDSYAHRGQCIHTLTGAIKNSPCKYSVQVAANEHILDEPIGVNLNHSFSPSVYIEGKNLIAAHDLKPDDEITFDYNKNEAVVVSSFDDLVTDKFGFQSSLPVLGYKNSKPTKCETDK